MELNNRFYIIGGGFQRFPDTAFVIIANNKTPPPIRVLSEASSPRKSQTQTGPRTTSAKDNKVKSAADKALEPIVYSTRPPPTWNIHIEDDMATS